MLSTVWKMTHPLALLAWIAIVFRAADGSSSIEFEFELHRLKPLHQHKLWNYYSVRITEIKTNWKARKQTQSLVSHKQLLIFFSLPWSETQTQFTDQRRWIGTRVLSKIPLELQKMVIAIVYYEDTIWPLFLPTMTDSIVISAAPKWRKEPPWLVVANAIGMSVEHAPSTSEICFYHPMDPPVLF